MARPKPDDPILRGFLDELERTPVEELRLLAVRPLDQDGHDAAREEAEDALRRSGRDQRHAAARAWVEELLRHAFSQPGYSPVAALGIAHEPLDAAARVQVGRTIDDAVVALLAEDLVDEATYDELLGPCAGLADDAGS
ncbi:MAG TPA: hypothetical protein VLA23_06500 [Candidatus Limnocylindrales bacterium]|nr:hypothetical protein [Candidatus Limnocylindrales bacterium]